MQTPGFLQLLKKPKQNTPIRLKRKISITKQKNIITSNLFQHSFSLDKIDWVDKIKAVNYNIIPIN